jgi:ParB/RepB/Spo0J family partition protein
LRRTLTVTRKEVETPDGGLSVSYELIAGERRLRASKLAGVPQVPVIIRSGVEDAKLKLELAIIENLQREDLNAIDRAVAFQKLHTEFHLSHGDIGKRMGKSREYVSNTLRLLSLPSDIQTALAGGKLGEGHARTLLSLNDKPDDAVEQGLITGVALSQFAFGKTLDTHVINKRISVMHEGQSEEEVRSAEQATQVITEAGQEMINEWNAGSFDKAVNVYSGAKRLITEKLILPRNRIWANDINEKISQLTERGLKGTIVVTGGAAHYGVMCELSDQLEGSSIKLQLIEIPGINSPDLQIGQLIADGFVDEDIPEEMKARALLGSMLKESWKHHFITGDDFDERGFYQHYDDAYTIMDNISNSMSVDEIRRLCEEKVDLFQFLKSHPLAQDIAKYLPA